MAVVSLSRERRERIKNHIRTMAVKDLAVEIADYKTTSDEDASQLYTRLHFWPHHGLVGQIPLSEWCRPVPEHHRIIKVLPYWPARIEGHYGDYTEEPVEPLFEVKFPRSADAFWCPRGGTRVHTPEVRVAVETLHLLAEDPAWNQLPGFQQLVTNLRLLADVKANQQKWADIEAQLTTLLSQVTTVNAAAKLVPSIKFYLPDDLLAQLNRQQEKKAAREIDTSALDLDAIAAAGATHALTKQDD